MFKVRYKKKILAYIDASYIRKRIKWASLIFFLILVLIGIMIITTFIGVAHIPVWTVGAILLSKLPGLNFIIPVWWEQSDEVIVILYRLPRVLMAGIVGGSLALAGTCMQGIFRNPMADPYIVGVSAGAGLGACTAILVGLNIYFIPVLAFLCAVITAFVVCGIATSGSGVMRTETLLLVGIAVSSFLSACIAFLIFFAGKKLHGIIFWLMGGLWSANWLTITITFPVFICGFFALYFFAKDLNLFQIGEESAQQLGIDVEKSKKIILVFTVLITAIAVAFVGIIGFVGLIIPHIARVFVGYEHRILLPVATIIGAIFLISADTAARAVSPYDFPVGMITAFTGAPFFIYLLYKRKYAKMQV
jgi:iron complex transport system permease protein